MGFQMKNNILEKIKISYSFWSTYKKSQLQAYYQYIIKEKKTNEGMPIYGKVGNVVHNAIEDYINTGENTFFQKWFEERIEDMRGINNSKLSKVTYENMYNKGIEIVDNYKYVDIDINPEEGFNFVFKGVKFVGFIDLVNRDTISSRVILIDWKTNSKNDYEMHRDQRLFYSWAIWKQTGKLVETQWIYLKDYGYNKTKGIHIDEFTEEDLIKFENELINFIDEIKEKGYDIDKYEAGEWKNPFNNYYDLCEEQVKKRISGKKQKVTLKIKGHFVFIETLDKVLEDGIDYATKFDLPEKFFMQQKAREKGTGILDINDVGVYHIYNSRFKCFPIGLLKKVRNIISEYADYYNKDIEVDIIDYRDKEIMNKINYSIPTINQNGIRLYDYQVKAVSEFLSKENGIIKIATGGGKTIIANEIILKMVANTLWIIDRKELLEQTKESIEKYLGIEVGVIMGDKVETDKSVTIATVQSLYSKLSKIKDFLYNINFVIVDEFHKSAAESYQKVFSKLPNTKYKLGLTATPYRSDGKEPVLFSILGDIIYEKSTKELIKDKYLVKPNIIFTKLIDNSYNYYSNYNEEYEKVIVNNDNRNNKIIDICDINNEEKILIFTKSVDHGKKLLNLLSHFEKGYVSHIHGSINKITRSKNYDNFVKSKSGILIITSSIGAEGLDIPDVNIVINASANKSNTKTIQILGRALRTSEGKGEAYYYDFIDISKNTKKHSYNRIKTLQKEGHKVHIVE